MNYYLPRLLAFVIGLIAFAIGLGFQKQERKRRELRKQNKANPMFTAGDMITITGSTRVSNLDLYPKTQGETRGLGSIQEQQQGPGQWKQ